MQGIHVPGTTMIEQGTADLSREVNMQALGAHQSDSLVPLFIASCSIVTITFSVDSRFSPISVALFHLMATTQ